MSLLALDKVPNGLTALLRLRTFGQNPTQFDNTVGPSVEVTPHYGSDLQVVSNDAAGAGAITRTIQGVSQFPGRLLGMSAAIVIGAAPGTILRVAVGYSPGAPFTSCCLGFASFTAPALAAGATLKVATQLNEPIVFPAGAIFVVEFSGDAAGVDHLLFGRHLFENYAPSG